MNRSFFTKTSIFVFILFTVLTSCSRDNAEKSGITEPARTDSAQKRTAFGDINPDDYAIHFSDSFGDICYLNIIEIQRQGIMNGWGTYYLEGKTLKVSAQYNYFTNMFSLSHPYDDFSFLYTFEIKRQKNYGCYTGSNGKEIYQDRMWIKLEKGSFPGMRTAKAANIDTEDFEIETRSRLEVLMDDR